MSNFSFIQIICYVDLNQLNFKTRNVTLTIDTNYEIQYRVQSVTNSEVKLCCSLINYKFEQVGHVLDLNFEYLPRYLIHTYTTYIDILLVHTIPIRKNNQRLIGNPCYYANFDYVRPCLNKINGSAIQNSNSVETNYFLNSKR